MERGGEAAASSEGWLSQGALGRAPTYSVGHGEPCGDIQVSRMVAGGGGAGSSLVACVLSGHICNISVHLLSKAAYQLFLVFYEYCYLFSE